MEEQKTNKTKSLMWFVGVLFILLGTLLLMHKIGNAETNITNPEQRACELKCNPIPGKLKGNVCVCDGIGYKNG